MHDNVGSSVIPAKAGIQGGAQHVLRHPHLSPPPSRGRRLLFSIYRCGLPFAIPPLRGGNRREGEKSDKNEGEEWGVANEKFKMQIGNCKVQNELKGRSTRDKGRRTRVECQSAEGKVKTEPTNTSHPAGEECHCEPGVAFRRSRGVAICKTPVIGRLLRRSSLRSSFLAMTGPAYFLSRLAPYFVLCTLSFVLFHSEVF
jgi:hypothetical protein